MHDEWLFSESFLHNRLTLSNSQSFLPGIISTKKVTSSATKIYAFVNRKQLSVNRMQNEYYLPMMNLRQFLVL